MIGLQCIHSSKVTRRMFFAFASTFLLRSRKDYTATANCRSKKQTVLKSSPTTDLHYQTNTFVRAWKWNFEMGRTCKYYYVHSSHINCNSSFMPIAQLLSSSSSAHWRWEYSLFKFNMLLFFLNPSSHCRCSTSSRTHWTDRTHTSAYTCSFCFWQNALSLFNFPVSSFYLLHKIACLDHAVFLW